MTAEKIWYLLGKKLSGEASLEELQELEQLMRSYPDVHYSIQNISDLWHLEKPVDHDEINGALKRHIERLLDRGLSFEQESEENNILSDQTRNRPLRRKLIFGSLITVLILGVSSFFFFHHNTSTVTDSQNSSVGNTVDRNEVSTKMGSRSKIVLPDGSVVWLNAGSKLLYAKTFGNETREVDLSGEGYFDVVKDPERPFIIHTQKINIKVLGTAFNVKSYPNDKTTETSLIRGMIEVTMKDRPNEKIILKPSEKLTVMNDANRLQTVPGTSRKEPMVAIGRINYGSRDSVIMETAWLNNQVFIQDKSFADLALDLERKYGVVFKFENEEVKQYKFGGSGGSFNKESIQQALRALQLANNFRYHIDGDTVIITK
ncbi:MAG: hypothetical protein C5B52_07520 [Bacteroidetes bacterium]|nr:MAG: hypothetical protein C5B52_07520 [Bacteroidota bacterium]